MMRQILLLLVLFVSLSSIQCQELVENIPALSGFGEETVHAKSFVTSHYEQRSEEYGNNIHGTLEAIQVQQRYVISTIYNSTIEDFNNNEIVIDIGGGDCINSQKLGIMLQKTVWCIEPFMRVNTSALTHAVYLKMDALSFTSKKTVRYNFALMKEVIHHFPPADVPLLFKNIHHQLISEGALVIMTRPENPYFLFSKLLKERWASTSAKLDKVVQPLTDAGFSVSVQSHNFTMTINKEDWKRFVTDRTWSTFETLTDEQIQREFTELDRVHPASQFNFTDNCIFIVARKE
mmetsp:Transcript_24925/g.27249  ORF Transcript_24925/g.27249 Transcript_24925/m.27249 type:complete len:291 (+) Transcript_24925:8-880(+)